MVEKDGSEVIITVKNYKVKGGLSKAIFDNTNALIESSALFEIQGPMGKGLEI
jgi:hypothetical protein